MGRKGGEGGCILALDTEALSLFSSPSCGFMAYLPVADFHLAMRGDLWQICCKDFDRGSRGKGISSRAPVLDRMAQGGSWVLGRFNTPGWPIKVWLLGAGYAQNTLGQLAWGQTWLQDIFKLSANKMHFWQKMQILYDSKLLKQTTYLELHWSIFSY